MSVASRLVELDIEKNDVFRDSEKSQWMFDKMKKLNNETLSVKNKSLHSSRFLGSSNGFMSSTQTGFRNTSMMIRPSTACSQLIDAQHEL
jgi:hypothetical protein